MFCRLWVGSSLQNIYDTNYISDDASETTKNDTKQTNEKQRNETNPPPNKENLKVLFLKGLGGCWVVVSCGVVSLVANI